MITDISNILNPETELEKRICTYAPFITGVLLGEPRPGHPEGKIIFHVVDVFKNIDEYCNEKKTRETLRTTALLHDTFKNEVDDNLPKSGNNHHGMIARRHAEKLGVRDVVILTLLEKHDEAYNSFQQGFRKGDWGKAESRVHRLITDLNKIGCLNLYLTFYRCDNETGNKSQDGFEWFKKQINLK